MPSSPRPTSMTPETMVVPSSLPDPWSPDADSRPNPNRLRAVRDIHAVLVEIA